MTDNTQEPTVYIVGWNDEYCTNAAMVFDNYPEALATEDMLTTYGYEPIMIAVERQMLANYLNTTGVEQ
jgi:hypothetical protein